MENINYGISPDEEMPEIMKEIEQNIKEQEGVEEVILEEPDGEQVSSEELSPEVVDEENVVEESLPEEVIDESDLFKEKYKTEKRKRKSVLADRQRLEQENHYLKTHLNGTVENNAELYGRNLYNDLEKITNIKKQALLGDDPDLLLEADEIYQRTLYKVNEYESYLNNKQSPEVNNDRPDNIDHEEQIKLDNGKQWVDEHPELIEDSYKYNPKIQKELGSFIEQFDRELIAKGRQNEILTDRYLNVLDEFIDNVKTNRSKGGYTTSKVGGVRNNFSNGNSGTMKVTLTNFDKNYAKNLGISEKEYLKYKIEDIKESKKNKGK